jgi:signal transduction histidine kinase
MDDSYGFEIIEASTGEEGITIINERTPDIILLDNKLPGIQGIDVLEYIKERNSEIMVAMITSYASLEVAVKATGFGACDFIPKPFTPQELKSSIDNLTKQLFLKRITKKLKQEGRQIRFQFLSVLSHELKTPLTAIEGYLNLMKDRKLGDQLDDYTVALNRSLERIQSMRNLILDLMDFTKVSFEKSKEKFEKINLFDLVNMSVGSMQPYAIQRNIQIKIHAQQPVEIIANPDDIEIILNNLISNAVKFNKDGGSVDITLINKNGSAIVSIKDSGIGMSADEVAKLFREFVRIKNEKTRNITGSGLGLSIVKKITEIYHGDINVKSEPDAGSCFTLTIPKQPSDFEK